MIVGELTADQQTIILIAEGTDVELAGAQRQLETVTPLVKVTDPPGAMALPASWPAVIQLAALYGRAWHAGPALTAWLGEQVRARTAPPAELAVPVPPGHTPRSYQVSGAAMIGAVGSALLFDDAGTGKTITALLGLRERDHAGHPTLPVLVVCPSAVVDSWVEHTRAWAPGWRVLPWRGSPSRRRRLAGLADVYVASYGTARMDAADTNPRHNPLIALEAATIVADEVHKLKAQATEQSRAVRRLADRRWVRQFIGLSGTPITHDPGDLWPTLYALCPGAYPSRERWVSRYCWTASGDYASKVLGLREPSEPEFRRTMLGQYRRVAKADVLSELPPKVYSVRQVELPPEYRKAYDDVEQNMLAEMPDGGDELAPMDTLSQLTGLIQIASAAADVKTWWETVEDPQTGQPVKKRHQNITLKAPSWKVDELLEVLAERPGKHTIAFAPSAQLVRLAGAVAAEKGYRVGYVIGGQSARERTAQIGAFQAGELDLICVTTGAGGVGLTLTAASTVVFLQRPWSIVEALQSEDRAHRIGSEIHDSIEVIDIVATNTIEARVREVLVDHADQLSQLVQDPRIVRELLGGPSVRDLHKKANAA